MPTDDGCRSTLERSCDHVWCGRYALSRQMRKDVSVMYRPMKKAGWVQRGNDVANPYYGAEMLGCGEKAGGSD